MSVLVLDTHVVVWWLEGSAKLPTSIRTLLDGSEVDLHLPALVVAELVDICVKGRTELRLQPVTALLRDDERFVLHDLTGVMALDTAAYATLPDIHDRCVVVTTATLIAAGHEAVLITRDKAIRAAGTVPTLWE